MAEKAGPGTPRATAERAKPLQNEFCADVAERGPSFFWLGAERDFGLAGQPEGSISEKPGTRYFRGAVRLAVHLPRMCSAKGWLDSAEGDRNVAAGV